MISERPNDQTELYIIMKMYVGGNIRLKYFYSAITLVIFTGKLTKLKPFIIIKNLLKCFNIHKT